jgi:outer membrane receptor for ferrienterochelin and colicins
MRVFSIVAFMTLTTISMAQDSLRTYGLEEVVVTGQYEPQSLSRSVYQVRTISAEQMMAKGAVNLQDVLNTQLNFRFSQDLALGTSSVTLNGLPGQYVKVLIDGVPVIGKSSGNEVNLNQINVNAIERIEIVEGPMAVAFGADAMAGVINIITKKTPDTKLEISARLQEETVGTEYGSDEGIHSQYVSTAYAAKEWYSRLEGGRSDFNGWTGNASGRERQWHPKTQWLGAGTVGVKRDRFDAHYRLDVSIESIYNPGEFQGNQALDQRYITKRFMHQLQGDARFGNLTFNGAFAFTDYSRKTQTVNVDEDTGTETLSLGEGHQDVTAFTGFTARGTFQYKFSPEISIQPGYDFNSESGEGERLKEGKHTIGDGAIFLSAEYTPRTFISIRPGVRFISNSQYEAPPLVWSVNTKFNLSSKLELRVSYGKGFRAPSLRELYFYFFDASHSIEGNPDLETEHSQSINAAVNWTCMETARFNVLNSFSVFYNDIDNMIASGYKPGNSVVTTYINVAHFRSQGAVIASKLKYHHLSFTAGFSYTGRYNDFEQEDNSLPKFVWSPEANANAAYAIEKIRLTANVFYKFTGKLPYYEAATVDGKEQIRLATLGSFQWTDVSLQKRFFKNFDLTLGVRNVFDVVTIQNSTVNTGDAHSGGSVTPVGYGRSYFATLNFHFSR